MEWENFFDTIGFWYKIFVDWFVQQPVYGQVLALIGLFTLFILAITLVYYTIKGIAYLIYYIFKGIYYLLKYIGYGFYKLFEGFYYLVSGNRKSSKQKVEDINIQNSMRSNNPYILEYCSECGRKLSEKMKINFKKKGMTFCVNCGKQLTLDNALWTLTVSH
ncbi:MAG: hypothetical protein ACFE9Q_04445 [Candidatus Hodarchaeota archaeon]